VKNQNSSKFQDKLVIFEDYDLFCAEKNIFLKVATPGEKPEAGILSVL
jgi:hypothetical protein